MNRNTLLLVGGVALLAYLVSRRASAALPPGVTPVIGAGGQYIITGSTDWAGIPAGTLDVYKLPSGEVIDPMGIPLGAKLSDGSTWHGNHIIVAQPSDNSLAP